MQEQSNVKQVKDNLELLELMMKDIKSAPDIFKPTNYWIHYERLFLPELKRLGLHDFRRRKNSVLTSFGATDLLPASLAQHTLPVWKPRSMKGKLKRIIRFFIVQLLNYKISAKFLNYISTLISGVSVQDIRLLCYKLAKYYGKSCGAKPIEEFEASTIGNPEDIFYVSGKVYTISMLYYYIQYAYCCQFMDFESIDTLMEIGSGSGKQIEVIKKLHPHICFYIFDIPPQLYVCEQYLSAVFPNSVVSYVKTRKMKNVPKEPGKIFIFGNWKLPELTNLDYDMFWNSASFQEMEPDVVLNYLSYVNKQTKKYIFLHENMKGMHLAADKTEHGVIEKTTLMHYKKGLKDFELLDLSKSIFLPRITTSQGYYYSFWKRVKI